MPQRLTPQQKKRRSLQRDCRNCFGQNDKASRKAIPRRKAIQNREFRRAAKQTLAHRGVDLDILSEEVGGIARGKWKKTADARLGNMLRGKLTRQIIDRLWMASERQRFLDAIETHLLQQRIPLQTVQDVVRQLYGETQFRHSTSLNDPLHEARTIDYRTAAIIARVLNRF